MSASIIDKRKHPVGFRNELETYTPTDSQKTIAARAAQAAIVTANLPHWCPDDAALIGATLGLVIP